MRGPVQLLQDAFGLFKDNAKLFVGIALVPVLLTTFSAEIIKYMNDGLPSGSLSEYAVAAFISVLFLLTIFMGAALVKAASNPSGSTVKDSYQYAWKNILPFVVVTILVTVAQVVGFILLIIPGIIFMVWFSFSYFIVLLEGKKGTEALKASREYVRGHWWAVAGRFLFAGFVAMLVYIAVGLAAEAVSGATHDTVSSAMLALVDLVVTPVMTVYAYLMYKELSGKATSNSDESDKVDGEHSHQPYAAM